MPRNKKGSLGGARGRNRGRGGHSQKPKYNVYSDDDAMDFIPFAAAGARTHENTGKHHHLHLSPHTSDSRQASP